MPDSYAEKRKQALLMITAKFSHSDAESNAFSDTSAIHLAAEDVADGIYGAERGNEIFFAFPSAYIASQLYFGRGHGALNRANIDVDHEIENNQFIYTKNHEGMPISASLVFIPADSQVDPRNGSRYEIGFDNNPVKNEAIYNGLECFVTSPEFKRIAEEIKNAGIGGLTKDLPNPSRWEEEISKIPHWETKARDMLQALLPIRDKVKEISGVSNDSVLGSLFSYPRLTSLEYANAPSEEWDRVEKRNFEFKNIIEKAGIGFVEAKNTISSHEYWEKYFMEHPEQRPSKIVYYTGRDPSRALNTWRENNGIVKKSKDETFGFPEHQVASDSPEANQGKDRFMELARKIIDDRFPEIRDSDEDHDFEEAEMTV